MRTIRTVDRIGRIMRNGDCLMCMFNSHKLRQLFGVVVWYDVGRWEADILETEMRRAAAGLYGNFSTLAFQRIVAPVPQVNA